LKEQFEDIKGVIRSRNSKKERQHNCQKEKNTNIYLQNTLHETKRLSNTNPTKTGDERILTEYIVILLTIYIHNG
jgi:hypothetical protein